jgi:hypothetical protein
VIESGSKKYYGKYRGQVANNVDPKGMGRLMVTITDPEGISVPNWAMPCVPLGGPQLGAYLVPVIGSKVWVEFEQGDTDRPIWVGSFWGSKLEVPATAYGVPPGAPVIVLQTPTQNALVISDVPVTSVPPLPAGGIMLKSGASSIVIDTTGVKITAPIVTINEGALVITLV